jgi:hypothetical protein
MRVLYILIIFVLPYFSIAQCPFQINDCKGKCPRFTDMNHDGYCDFTIITLPPVVDTMVIHKDTLSITDLLRTENNKLLKDSSQFHHKSSVSNSKNIQSDLKVNEDHELKNDQPSATIQTKSDSKQNVNQIDPKLTKSTPTVKIYKGYSLILISGLSIGLYLISFFLAKYKVIEIRIHRKIWNILLIATFLVTGLLGLFMVVQLNYSLKVSWFKPLLSWHVNFGIGMALISIFHVLWHWSYIKKIFNFRPVRS